jgi:hypothetical protein
LFERPLPTIKQLTFGRGTITGARFTSDERTVVYSASWDGKPNDIFVARLDSPDARSEARSLGLPPAKLLSVSSRGEVAVLLTGPAEVGDPFVGTVARVSLAGGVPRPILEDVEDADWSPDGQELAVEHRVDGQWQLEYPIGKVLWPSMPGSSGTHGMRVSPLGDKVALNISGVLTVVDRSGARQSWTLPDAVYTGLGWAPRGDAVWVSGGPAADKWFIRQFALNGSRRDVYHAAGIHVLHDVGKSGAVLLHHGSEHWGIRVKPRDDEERELPGVRDWIALDISRDGAIVIAGDPRDDSIFLYPARGGEPVLFAHGSPFWRTHAELSPDGRWFLGGPVASDNMAQLIPTGAGEPRKLPLGDWSFATGSFPDADHIYWNAVEQGAPSPRGFIEDIATGAIQAVTPVGVEGVPSPLVGGAVLGRKSTGTLVWFPRDGGEPRPTAARLPTGSHPLRTAPDGKSMLVSTVGIPTRIDRLDLVTGRREAWKTLSPPDLTGVVFMNPWVKITPDGEAYAYTYLRVFQDLYMMEGLR